MPFRFGTLTNESLVARARNKLVRLFLQTDCSHLVFIDADIEFSVDSVFALLDADKDVVTGAYPMKTVLLNNLVDKPGMSLKDIELAVAHYVVNVKFKDEQARDDRKVDIVDGLVELLDAGTGFMCIKREVIEKMMEAYPETKYYTQTDTGSEEYYALFDTMIDDGRYLSEDYTFCRRWQKIGGKIWMHPKVTLNHMGSYLYRGRELIRT
jgi:GT2 family glycosyltransferase